MMHELIAGFSAGTLASFGNVCLLPLYPGLIAFLAGNAGDERARRVSTFLGLAVLAGVVTMMTAIGLLVVGLNATLAGIFPVLLPLVYVPVIGMGVLLLAGKNPFVALQTLPSPIFKNPFLSAFMYGLLLGPMTLPCTGPILVGAFAYGAGVDDVINGLLYFLAFALGFGWILAGLPLLTLPLQRRMVGRLTAHRTLLNVVSGLLLIAIGLFGVLTELVPKWLPEFDLGEAGILLYWLATLAIITGTAGWLYRHE